MTKRSKSKYPRKARIQQRINNRSVEKSMPTEDLPNEEIPEFDCQDSVPSPVPGEKSFYEKHFETYLSPISKYAGALSVIVIILGAGIWIGGLQSDLKQAKSEVINNSEDIIKVKDSTDQVLQNQIGLTKELSFTNQMVNENKRNIGKTNHTLTTILLQQARENSDSNKHPK